MTEPRSLRPPYDVDERYLDGLRRCTAHKELVVAAALHYCAEMQIIPPQWVLAESSALMCELLKREKAQTRGRATGHLARYRQDMWDLERWNAVDQIRQIREKIQHDDDLLKAILIWKRIGSQRIIARCGNGYGATAPSPAPRCPSTADILASARTP